nr:MAG TPA: hypothetical protein [Caudoviricetes sp.]
MQTASNKILAVIFIEKHNKIIKNMIDSTQTK